MQAIKEFTELGSGYKIAMRDLEIRGAGNLLGAEQSGHIEAVGYDLYCKLLNEAVREMKGEEITETNALETAVDIDTDAYIPDTYIRNETQKLDMYKRIAMIRTKSEADELEDELLDRFGNVPTSVRKLLQVALIKAAATEAGMNRVKLSGSEVGLFWCPISAPDTKKLTAFLDSYGTQMKFVGGKAPKFTYTLSAARGKTMAKPDIWKAFEEILELLEAMKEKL